MRRATALDSQWEADTQSCELLTFKNCKGGYFSVVDDYGLKVIGKASQNGTPAIDAPIDIQYVKAGTVVRCCGKNLFNKPLENGYYKNADYDITTATRFVSSKIFLDAGTYCLSANVPLSYVRIILAGVFYKVGMQVFTLKEPGYVGFSVKAADDSVWKHDAYRIQLEIGTEVSDYEPYVCNEIIVPCDLYGGDIWYPMTGRVERYSRKYVLTGEETFSNLTPSQSVVPCYGCNVPIDDLEPGIMAEYAFCTHAVYKALYGNGLSKYGIFSLGRMSNYWANFRIACDVDTIEEFAVWVKSQYDNGVPVTLVYKKVVPTIEYYDPQPIFAQSGTVNVMQEPIDLQANLEATMLIRG